MSLLDLSVIMHHTYNGAGFGGSGGWYTTTTYVDPETVMATADVLTALF